MPNGQSVITTAQTMMASVSNGIQTILDSANEHLAHIERRKAHLETLLHGSHTEAAAKMFAALDAAIAALKKCITALDGQPQNAAAIEARL